MDKYKNHILIYATIIHLHNLFVCSNSLLQQEIKFLHVTS